MGHPEVWGPAGDKLLIVGLTGGIASGKTEVALELIRLGALVVDADAIAREVILPGTSVYEALVREYGREILDDSGAVDRPKLAKLVFGDKQKRLSLNSITHPAIIAEIIRRIEEHAEGLKVEDVPAAIVDAALIVDIGASSVFDKIVVVTADARERARRLRDQRGMSDEEAQNRISSQVQDSQRIESADLIIENNGTLDELRVRVGQVWRAIERESRLFYS